jgi:hypothetical protein
MPRKTLNDHRALTPAWARSRSLRDEASAAYVRSERWLLGAIVGGMLLVFAGVCAWTLFDKAGYPPHARPVMGLGTTLAALALLALVLTAWRAARAKDRLARESTDTKSVAYADVNASIRAELAHAYGLSYIGPVEPPFGSGVGPGFARVVHAVQDGRAVQVLVQFETEDAPATVALVVGEDRAVLFQHQVGTVLTSPASGVVQVVRLESLAETVDL